MFKHASAGEARLVLVGVTRQNRHTKTNSIWVLFGAHARSSIAIQIFRHLCSSAVCIQLKKTYQQILSLNE